ncbi:hypothetical protein RJ640_007009 [Escallonia rubra]|uniref:CCHC-type domain-containing protein n=1 Tax=Escallonia rubra TaxID=112253 RepID=A0AA88R8E4_9ASTE|nr:hypothetical protein RJ640_007009 [Escallonia rubra]
MAIKFDNYKKCANQTMKQHLRAMSNMIRELKAADNNLTDEQTLRRHLELEDERLGAAKASEAYAAEFFPCGTSRSKQNRGGGNGNQGGVRPAQKKGKTSKGKRGKKGKKDKSKMTCYNCNKKGHFARECTTAKRILLNPFSDCFVASCVLVAKSIHVWIVDSGAADHIIREGIGFVEYHRVPSGSKRVYMGNQSSVEVLGIGTYKVEMREGRALYLHNVLCAMGIRRNLLSVLSLLKLGFSFQFKDNKLTSLIVYPQNQYRPLLKTLRTEKKPDLSLLRPCGLVAYVRNTSHQHGKLGPRGKKSIFIRGDVSTEVELYELEDPDVRISGRPVETEKLIPQPPNDKGSALHTRNDKELIAASKRWLSSNFDMKDMGEANYMLGVNIFRDRSKRLLGLSQKGYLEEILERIQMHKSKPIDTLAAKGDLSLKNCPKTPKEKEKMTHVPYSGVIGSLMYSMMCTRPDICYAIGLVSRYQLNPSIAHWQAVKRILLP